MKKILISIFCGLLPVFLYAQSVQRYEKNIAPQCYIATPNASSIARYGDIPMNPKIRR